MQEKVLMHYREMVEGLMKNKKREGSKKFLKLVSRISEEEKLTKMIERTLK